MDRYHHGNLRAALLKAAFQLVAKVGMEGFTLREVARRAGVSHNAPYRHFKSREDLVAALATEGLRQLFAALQKAVGDTADPVVRIRAAARVYLHFAIQNPSRFHVMFHSPIEWRAHPEYTAAYTDSLNLLGSLMRSHPDLAIDVDTAGELVWAGIHGITELGIARRLWDGDVASLERLVDSAVGIILRGMRQQAG